MRRSVWTSGATTTRSLSPPGRGTSTTAFARAERDRRDRNAQPARPLRGRARPDVARGLGAVGEEEHRRRRALARPAASPARPSRSSARSTERVIAVADRRPGAEPELGERGPRRLAVGRRREHRVGRGRERDDAHAVVVGHLVEERERPPAWPPSNRVGWTSVASIEREVSIASTIVASSRVTSRTTCGRATPTDEERRARRARGSRRARAAASPATRRRGSGRAPGSRTARRRAGACGRRARRDRRGSGSRAGPTSASGQAKVTCAASARKTARSRSQSRSVESARARRRRPRARARPPSARRRRPPRTARGASVVACRPAAVARSPGRRARACRPARAPARAGRGSRPRRTSCRPARREQRAPPVARAAEVGDDDDERALARRARRRARAPRRAASRRRAVRLVPVAEGEEQADEPRPSLRRRQDALGRAAEADDADPVAAHRRDVADRERHAVRDVRLAPVRGAERHRRRDVEHDPRDEHALGEVDADVRLGRPRGHVPVDPPHVVARHVRPHLRELGAAAEQGRAVVAREQAVDPPGDRQVERLSRPSGIGPGPGRAGVGSAPSARRRVT